MTMATIHLTGRITEKGELQCELPEGLPAGEAYITIEIPAEAETGADTESLRVEPLTGAEIVKAGLVGGWEGQGISDGQTWLDQRRREQRERLRW
jgi:hypothetical protein